MKAFETVGNTSADADVPAAFRTIDKLGSHFSMLMGRGGVQALHARALVLATAEVPWLASVRVVEDGKLEGLAAARATVDAADFSEGEIVLLAQIIRLLVAFIGPALTLRLISQLWPQLPFNAAELRNA
ncbi:MAG: hypothetical protein O9972_06645 [Burkholderiales bacterium]|nr:hypothetical protein [Burkholderiales bacterium]